MSQDCGDQTGELKILILVIFYVIMICLHIINEHVFLVLGTLQ